LHSEARATIVSANGRAVCAPGPINNEARNSLSGRDSLVETEEGDVAPEAGAIETHEWRTNDAVSARSTGTIFPFNTTAKVKTEAIHSGL
jgi:hypothetical protein